MLQGTFAQVQKEPTCEFTDDYSKELQLQPSSLSFPLPLRIDKKMPQQLNKFNKNISQPPRNASLIIENK